MHAQEQHRLGNDRYEDPSEISADPPKELQRREQHFSVFGAVGTTDDPAFLHHLHDTRGAVAVDEGTMFDPQRT